MVHQPSLHQCQSPLPFLPGPGDSKSKYNLQPKGPRVMDKTEEIPSVQSLTLYVKANEEISLGLSFPIWRMGIIMNPHKDVLKMKRNNDPK